MSDWPLPPYVEPHGARADDGAVIRAWLAEEISPFSDRLHVEGPVLLVDRDVTVALRLSHRSALLRRDLPSASSDISDVVTEVLTTAGLQQLDEDNPLAMAVAVQMVGLRMDTWDLWGTDIDMAFAALREAAVGGRDDLLFQGGDQHGPFSDDS